MLENTNVVTIERAMKDDDRVAAELTLMAYKDMSYEIFGAKNDEEILKYYSALWQADNNRFSYCYSFLAKVEGTPIGLMTCYIPDLTKKLILPTIKQVLGICGARFIMHILTHLNYFVPFASTVEANADEFYIGTLAVLPEYRSQRVGVKLLEYMRQLAKAQGYSKCSLLVDADNEGGILFYEKNGFVKALHEIKPREYYKMVDSF